MTEEHDEAEANDLHWRMGNRAAWRAVLSQAIGELGYDDQKFVDEKAWMLEREAAVAALRSLCEDFGDNDWPESLHLADVIEKHLGRHLWEDAE